MALISTVGPLSSTNINRNSTLTFDFFYGIGFLNITLDASPPTAETATITVGGTIPANGSTVTIGGVTYTFSTAHIHIAPGSGCTVYSNGSTNTVAGYLSAAISTGGQGALLGVNGGNYYSYYCAGSGGNSAVTTGGTIPTINLTAVTPGSTGFTFSETGATNFTTFTHVLGTNGTTSGGTFFTNPTFAYWSGNTYDTPAELATNIAYAINNDPYLPGLMTATANLPAPGDVTITELYSIFDSPDTVTPGDFSAFNGGGTIPYGGVVTAQVQPNVFPAKYGASLTTASCGSDFVVYPTGQPGATGAANIIAYNNLYEGGCTTGIVPSVYWAYNTGAATVTTSPIISPDAAGTKVAFIQSTSTTMSLVVVKWAPSTTEFITEPGVPTTSTNISGCPAPCMTVTTISGSVGDAYSSPFYDYRSDDAMYVGDNDGHLYKITGVFNGTIAPAVTQLTLTGSTYDVGSPVYDPTSGCVFVGDSEGYLYSVASGAGGTVCSGGTFADYGHSRNLGNGAANEGIFDAPLVDSTSENVYAFVTGSAAIGNCVAGDNCVVQFGAGTISSGSTTAAPTHTAAIGTGGASYNLYDGIFDNVYFSSSAPSGNLYAIGNTGVTTGGILYQIPITAGALGTPLNALGGSNVLTVSGAYPVAVSSHRVLRQWYERVHRQRDGRPRAGTDYLFFSVNQGTGTGTGCKPTAGNGCIRSYNISTPGSVTLSGFENYATPGTNGCWATGGIVIDNAATNLTGAPQIYFVALNGA